jgi:hypothetical protein
MAEPSGAGGINSLLDLMSGRPPEQYPDPIGSPYTYGPPIGGSGAGGMPDTITGGTMPVEDWINANRGPKGFFQLMGDPTFQGGGGRWRTDLPMGGGGQNAPRGFFEPHVQGVLPMFQAGAYGLSTSNPKLMAQMGYADSGQREGRSYLGWRDMPMYIMRNGEVIDVERGMAELAPSSMMSGEQGPSLTSPPLFSGAMYGFPSYSRGFAGWPGAMGGWGKVFGETT